MNAWISRKKSNRQINSDKKHRGYFPRCCCIQAKTAADAAVLVIFHHAVGAGQG